MNSLRITLLFTFMILVVNVPETLTGSAGEESGLEIPEQCKSLGLCDGIPNYPHEQAKKVIKELKDSGILSDDKVSLTTVPDDTRRVGPIEENIELCHSDVKTIHPQAAVDAHGKWHVVLNPDDDPIQKYTVEMCRENLSSCAAFVVFQPGYKGICIQNFLYESMRVLHPDGKTSKKRLRLPSSCSCVVQRIQN